MIRYNPGSVDKFLWWFYWFFLISLIWGEAVVQWAYGVFYK